MSTLIRAARRVFLTPYTDVLVGVLMLTSALWPLSGLPRPTMLGVPAGPLHGMIVAGLIFLTRGGLAATAPVPVLEREIMRPAPLPLRQGKAPQQLPPPLPDNIIQITKKRPRREEPPQLDA